MPFRGKRNCCSLRATTTPPSATIQLSATLGLGASLRLGATLGLGLTGCLSALLYASPSLAESSTQRPAPAALEAVPAPGAKPNGIMLPKVLPPAEVPYPPDGRGDATVVLELTIEADGRVSNGVSLSGSQPFRDAALQAARTWRFQPATQAGSARRARVRFEVHFTQPSSPELAEATSAETTGAAAPRTATERGPATPSPAKPRANSKPPVTPPTQTPQTLEVNVRGEQRSPTTTLSRAEARQLPGSFGDPFRAVEALPGVTPIVSGLPYFFVRGAPPGNVGYFYDGVRVPALFHVALGPSVIHPAFVEHVELFAGPFPARYGRFAGGVVAAESPATTRSDEPGRTLHGEASVRPFDAGGMLDIPFAEGRGAVLLGGRYSYTQAVIALIAPDVDLSYWDYQARLHYDLTARDTLSLLAFGSGDFVAAITNTGAKKRALADIAFHRVDLRYDRRVTPHSKLRVATTLGTERTGADGAPLKAHEDSVRLRAEFEQQTERTRWRLGADVEQGVYSTEVDDGALDQDQVPDIKAFQRAYSDRRDLSSAVYLETDLTLTPKLTLSPGLRVDLYESAGQLEYGISPRLSAKFKLTPELSVTHGIGLADQPPSFVIPLPGVQPTLAQGLQRSVQSSAGLALALPYNFSLAATAFQSILFNTSDSLGVSRLDNGDPNISEQSRSLGSSRGIELLVSRSLSRRLGGYVAYTLSRARRALGRAEGPSSFDRTHVFNAAVAYDLGKRWRAGTRLTFYTGIPADVAYLEVARHPPRTLPFYRVDFRLEKRWLLGNGGAWWSVVLEVLNTTFHEEMLNRSCSAYVCRNEYIGPVTLPSLGVEAAF